jgi:hypothetical protein
MFATLKLNRGEVTDTNFRTFCNTILIIHPNVQQNYSPFSLDLSRVQMSMSLVWRVYILVEK